MLIKNTYISINGEEEKSYTFSRLAYNEITPGSWIERGVERFLDRLEIIPESLKHQLAFSLQLYIKSIGDSFLIIGDHKKLHQLIKLGIDKNYVNYYFTQIHSD